MNYGAIGRTVEGWDILIEKMIGFERCFCINLVNLCISEMSVDPGCILRFLVEVNFACDESLLVVQFHLLSVSVSVSLLVCLVLSLCV